jgi:site-specific recombinase XerD
VYNNRPHQKDSFYRTLKSFYKWSIKFGLIQVNPMLLIEPPKLPETILRTITPEQVHILLETAETNRDKAIIALLADSGARRSEFTSIQVHDLDLQHNRIRVAGKGQKEGFLVFGDRTKAFLQQYITESSPVGSLFSLKPAGLRMMLRRLGEKAGIPVNPHAFRRGFATTLRKMGVGELDIQQLGRWESLEMVRRYTKAFTFDDAAERYKPIVT